MSATSATRATSASHGSRRAPDDDGTVPGPTIHVDQEHPESDASLSDLLSRLVADLTLLLRQEVELAKTELKQELTVAAKASAMLVAGGVLAFVAVLLLAWAAAWGLAVVMPTGLAFLLVAIVVGAAAAGAVVTGKKRLETVDVTPHRTVDSLQRDKETLTERTPQ